MRYQFLLLLSLLSVSFDGLNGAVPIVDIVISVKTELTVLQPCINSLLRQQPNTEVIQQRIIFADDGSPKETRVYEHQLCDKDPRMFLCGSTNSSANGYTHAINMGIQLAQVMGKPASDSVVLLNSDTIVSENWLLHLHDALFSSSHGDKVALVGPLSNAASFQSIPTIRDANDGIQYWSTNPPPIGLDLNNYARDIQHYALSNQLPHVPLMILNGFCFMFKRSLIKAIGLFDHIHFARGYGEEVDFSIRANNAGYKAMVVPSVFIYHQKTASFTNQEKLEQKAKAKKYLREAHGDLPADFAKEMEEGSTIQQVRHHAKELYDSTKKRFSHLTAAFEASATYRPPSILFVSHTVAMRGGMVSIMQEALQMLRYGIKVSVALPNTVDGTASLNIVKTLLPDATDEQLNKMIVHFEGNVLFPKDVSENFIEIAGKFDIVVATYCLTMHALKAAVAKHPHIMPAYYVQDYEPWFWVSPFGGNDFGGDPNVKRYIAEAKESYSANDGRTVMLAKTKWTAHMVSSNHENATVHKVIPSLDHNTYYPDRTELAKRLREKGQGTKDSMGVFNILAMIRPRTPRRNPANTIEVMLRLAHAFPKNVVLTFIGCKDWELNMAVDMAVEKWGAAPHRNKDILFKSKQTNFLGVIQERTEIARLFRKIDIFIDLSWWQAFGRAGLEAMASGSVAVMPLTGAAPEICRENFEFCMYHDGNDIDGFYNRVVTVMHNDSMRHDLIRNGLRRSRHFSVEWAAASMANEMFKGYKSHRMRVTN